MKIAFTADLHLRNKEEYPERFNALEDIFKQLIENRIGNLVIAGDLFDLSLKNFSDFEALCNKNNYGNFKIYIIPGNHDSELKVTSIVAKNVEIITKPKILKSDKCDSCVFLLPYSREMTMGEVIETSIKYLSPNKWILVGHGDWVEGIKQPNPFEPGVYMPLTSIDIQRYQPTRVFLGHIHCPMNKERIHYVGSPCPLDITEIGKRSFLIYELETDSYEIKYVNTDYIFFDETLVILPMEDQRTRIQQMVQNRISEWKISDTDRDKVNVRVIAKGYCADRKELLSILSNAFKGFSFYQGVGPDISEVSISEDFELRYIAEKLEDRITHMELFAGPDGPTKEDILYSALKVIYGE